MEMVKAELVAPEQFFVPAQESQALWNGERQLLLAVLEHAVHEFCKYCHSCSRRGKRLFREVEAWLWSGKSNWLYSFESICLHLDLNPDTIRWGLQRYAEATAPPPSPSAGLLHKDASIDPAPVQNAA